VLLNRVDCEEEEEGRRLEWAEFGLFLEWVPLAPVDQSDTTGPSAASLQHPVHQSTHSSALLRILPTSPVIAA
jgi:hypothetical protein